MRIGKEDFNDEDNPYWGWYECPNCGDTDIVRTFHYCPNCGIKLEWDLET